MYSTESVNFDDTLDFKVVNKSGIKLMSNERYALDMLKMYESSFVNDTYEFKEGQRITGCVTKIVNGHYALDFGAKDFAYLSNLECHLKIGDEITAILTEVNVDRNQSRGFSYKCSTKEYSKYQFLQSVKDSIGTSKVYDGKLTCIINNSGFVVNIDGLDCFMPGSLAGVNKVSNFQTMVGATLKVMAVSLSDDGSSVIVSHKSYLESLIPHELAKLDMNRLMTGHVTGTTPFAVFVEFNGCLTGMIHKSCMDSATLENLESRNIKAGDEISFYVKDVVNDKKIILSQVKEDFWDLIDKYVTEKVTFKGKIIKTKEGKGYLVVLDNGMMGILPLKNTNKYSINSMVNVKIKDFIKKDRKIFFEE